MKIFESLREWFEKNGLIKILASLFILILCSVFVRKFPHATWISYIGCAAGVYLLISLLVFAIGGIVDTFKNLFSKKSKKDSES
jgi:predicted branched-subunit amino acid permease